MSMILPGEPIVIDDEEITVYKKLWVGPDYVCSLMYFYKWNLGENISSRESIELTENEIETGMIQEGFHFYLEPQDDDENTTVVEMKVKKEDIVAVGFYMGQLSLVAMKAVF